LHGVLLVAAVLLLVPLPNAEELLVVVPALSPFVATASILATHSLQLATWIGLTVGVITLARHRWFCRWICPTGTCADYAMKLGIRMRRPRSRLPPIGQWIAIMTLVGAILGYPLLLWLDPLALLSAAVGLPRIATSPEVGFGATGFAAVLLLSFAWPGAWCHRVCPLGAFQDLLFRFVRAIRRLFRSNRRAGSATPHGWTRRVVLGAAFGGAWAALTKSLCHSAPTPLRPPGAVDEIRFRGLCIRCGSCQRACPTDIIRPDTGGHGVSSLLTPRLEFDESYCREDCVQCTDVCPSGALTPVAVAAKQHAAIGWPHVDMDLCLLGDDRDCRVCRNSCPFEAIRLVFSEEEYTLTPQIDPERCPGCGACEIACPTEPTKAILIRPVSVEPPSEPSA